MHKIISKNLSSCVQLYICLWCLWILQIVSFTSLAFTWRCECALRLGDTQLLCPGCLIALTVLTAAAPTLVIQPPSEEWNQMVRGRGRGSGTTAAFLWAVKTKADDTCIYPFWAVVFPTMADALKGVSGKSSQTGEICRVAVKHFFKTEAFLRYVIMLTKLSLKVGAPHISVRHKQHASLVSFISFFHMVWVATMPIRGISLVRLATLQEKDLWAALQSPALQSLSFKRPAALESLGGRWRGLTGSDSEPSSCCRD